MRKQKILLLNPPGKKLYLRDYYCSSSSKANYYWHPIDLLIQSGILKEHLKVNVLDAQIMRLSETDTSKMIEDISPEVIFFLAGSACLHDDIAFIEKIKNNRIMIGSGDILRFEGNKILKKYDFIDGILLDFTSHGIVEHLNNESSSGMLLKDNLSEFILPKEKSGSFSYPLPLHNLFPLKKYRLPLGKQVPFTSVLTSYGCPFNCIYCNSGNLGFKLRQIDNLLEELYFITDKLNIFKIFFRDMTFTADRKHLLSVCEEIKKYKLYWNCYSRIDTIDEEILSVMKDAGCYLIQFGIESGDEEILMKYKPDAKLNEIKKNILLCKKNEIDAIGHFIIGFPEDTKKTITQTLNFALSLPLDGVSLNIATPRYGSKFRERCINDKLITSELISMDNSSSFSVILNKDISKVKKYILLRYYFRLSYIMKIIKKIKSFKDIQNVASQGIAIIRNIWSG